MYAGGFPTHINLKTERTIFFDEVDPDGTVVLDLTKTIYVTRGSCN